MAFAVITYTFMQDNIISLSAKIKSVMVEYLHDVKILKF